MIEIRLPKPGPEFDEATITSWERQEGDKIETGDILAIIKTPLGSFKVAAEEEGVLSQISQNANDRINFDEPIAVLDALGDTLNGVSNEHDDDTLPLPIDEAPDETVTPEDSILNETENEAITEEPTDIQPEEAIEEISKQAIEEIPEEITEEAPSVSISPAAKKLAEKFGINYTQLQGTGQGGKILYIDVENAINEGPPPNATKTEPKQEAEVTQETQKTPLKIKWDEPEPEPEGNMAELPNLEISQTHTDEEPSTEKQDSVEPVAEINPDLEIPDETAVPTETPIQEAPVSETQSDETDLPFPDYEEISIQFHLAKREDLIIPFNSVKKKYAETQAASKRKSLIFTYLRKSISLKPRSGEKSTTRKIKLK